MTKKQATSSDATLDASFAEVAAMIQQARSRAYQGVNAILVDLYWRIGAYISHKLETAAWGTGVVPQLAQYLEQRHPDMKGFTRSNLFRMRQFYETYRDHEIVAPLVRQLPWTHNLIIFGRCKRPEEREFYVRLAAQERWNKRELERQIDGSLFERAVFDPPKVSAMLKQLQPTAEAIFKDAYLTAM
jgi:predicted nuclease of restriction endonuclease-like (RecB) superfamily